MPGLNINTTAAKEHVPEIKRRTWVNKEWGRGVLNTLLFKKMPQIILIELIYHVVLWLNTFPLQSGISETLSPREEIVLRHKLDYKKHCRAPFGSYCEAHDKPAPTNSMVTRATPCVVLGPTENLQGTYKFFNFITGAKIKRQDPMPDSVFKRVERYARKGATANVGTLKDGYLRKVPLPRAPLQQSPALAAVVTDSQTPVPDRQITTLVPAYSQVPQVPTWSKLTHSLFGGLGARLLRAPLLM